MNQSPGILTDIFERITDAFVALDTNWCYTYINKKAGEIFQRNPAEMIGKNIWTEFPQGIGQSFYKAYYKAMAEQQYIHVEAYYSPYDKWFENHIYPSSDGLTILFRDITEQKKHTRELELKEKHFQGLLENNHSIIALTDDALNPIYRSPSSTPIMGWTDEDIKVTGDINRVHPDDIITMNTTVAEAIKKPGIPQPYISRYLHKNGHYIWLEGTATKLPDVSVVKGIVFNARDVTEKMELELLLLKANKLARIGNWDVDLIKQTVYWNDITREIHEAESSFVPDLATAINFYKEGASRELITQKVKEAIELGKPFDEELEIVTVKNNVRWIRTIGETEMVDGKCVKIYGSFQDINEKKLAEEKILFEQLDKMALINSTDDFMWSVSKDLKLIAANKAFISNIKIDTGVDLKAGDKILLKVFPQELLNQWQSYYKRALMGESFREESYSKNSTDKSYTWIETAFNPIYLNEDIIGIACYARNITERKKAEEQIKESEEKFRTLVQQAADGIVIVDEAGNYLEANESMAKLTGYTVNELKTMNGSKIVEEEDLRSNPIRLEEIKTGNPVFVERVIVKKDGTLRNIEISAKLMQKDKVICILRDATERKKTQEKIRLNEIKLLKAQEIGKFGYWQQDMNSNTVWASKEAMRIYGLGTEDGELQRAAIAACIIDVDMVREAAINLVEHGKEYNIDIRINPADGSPMKYISALAELEKNEKGEPIRIVGTLQDITERKKAEEELRQSEGRTRRIFESDMIGFIYFDLNGEILDANDRFLEMTGYSKQDLSEHKINWSKMTPPEYHDLDRIAIEHIVKTGICQPYEKEYFRKDGSRLAILIGATALEGGNFGKGVSYVLDISERIKAENKLKENEIYLRTILDTEPECVKILNSKGELLSMNPAGLAMIEADNEQQVLGHCMTELVDEKYRMGFNRLSKEVFNGNPGTFEFEVTGLKGGRRWLEIHAVPLKDTSGNITNLLGVTADITNRKLAALEITASELKYRRLFESAKDGIFILNAETGFIEDVNSFLCDMLHYSHEEFLDKQLWEISLFKDIAANKESFLKLKSKKYVRYENLPLVTKTGQPIWVEFISNVYDVKGKAVIQCSIRNITDRKIAEDEITKTTEELRQLTTHLQTIREEERKRIAREIHDELGQQLTAIKMDTVWIDKQVSSESVSIKNKLKYMIELLDGSHQSVRKILNELRPAALDDNGLLETLEWLGKQFTDTSNTPVHFTSNQTTIKLQQEAAICIFRVYQEALTNIMRYAEAKKVVSSLNIIDKRIVLIIEDDGKGFDTAAVQSKNSFGLLGMKERVHSLNGAFDLISLPDKGTTIVVNLPHSNAVPE